MTKDEVIAMAREADSGFEGGPDADGTMSNSIVGMEAIERFAELVAELVAAKERERCAKVCDEVARKYDGKHDPLSANVADECAAAIRKGDV